MRTHTTINSRACLAMVVSCVVVCLISSFADASRPQDPNATLPAKSPTEPSTARKAETSSRARRRSKRTRPSSRSAIARERGRAEEERRRREGAEREAAEARAAQAAAERKAAEKKDVWLVFTIVNKTTTPILYLIRRGNGWEAHNVSPGYQAVHSLFNESIALIRYDDNPQDDRTGKYSAEAVFAHANSLETTAIIGHEPTESEKARAKVNYFKLGADGKIQLYAQPSEGAEQEAAQARAAQAAAERKAAEKKDVWFVAWIINKTKTPIPYQILRRGSWENYTLPPGYLTVHSSLNEDIAIRYNYNWHEQKYIALHTTAIIGHEPTESEKSKAKVNYFKLERDGNIHLY